MPGAAAAAVEVLKLFLASLLQGFPASAGAPPHLVTLPMVLPPDIHFLTGMAGGREKNHAWICQFRFRSAFDFSGKQIPLRRWGDR